MSNNSDIPQITILTPTWNRRHLLPRLYQSLVDQKASCGTFDWLVVDDGSTDGTSEWVEGLIHDAPFSIRLIRQENGGKHRALNRAASELAAPWVLIVDSDDWLLPGAIMRIMEDTATMSSDVLAIVAPLDIMGLEPFSFHGPGRVVDYSEWRGQKQVREKSIVMRGGILRDNPFPEFEGEKFVAEGVVWARAFRARCAYLSPNRIVGAEYQVDGLSALGVIKEIKSPLSAISRFHEGLKIEDTKWRHVKRLLHYHRCYWHAIYAMKRPRKHGFKANPLWLAPAFALFLRDRVRAKHHAHNPNSLRKS